MREYDNAISVMKEMFSKDYNFALATTKDDIPTVRFVDTYYYEGSFYIVTYSHMTKVKQIEANTNVELCNRLYRFSGKAFNIGHPLKPENKEIRDLLIKVFEPWYFAHNDENDERMCYIKIDIESGFYYKDKVGYQVDFIKKEVKHFPFEFDIIPSS